MIEKTLRFTRIALHGVASAMLLGVAGTSMAQAVPQDFAAAPDIYKVVAENDQYRLVEATWKPGQRDIFHSHPAMLFSWVTGCSARVHLPDGTTREFKVSAGEAGTQMAVPSHSFENVGQSECKIIMFEQK